MTTGFPVEQKSSIRYQIVLVCIATAFIMYLDRVCLSEIVKSQEFLDDSQLSKEQIGKFLGAFFFSYALFQVPAGWFSDRFGARKMLTIYIIGWSVMTGLTGFMTSLAGLTLARLGCGVAQAGAYPTI
ncbi:MAG: MFS transporter, partial [Planctomycetaceae bacterium]|nr:MFS transporter [Planctomycetaceae bacterium]